MRRHARNGEEEGVREGHPSCQTPPPPTSNLPSSPPPLSPFPHPNTSAFVQEREGEITLALMPPLPIKKRQLKKKKKKREKERAGEKNQLLHRNYFLPDFVINSLFFSVKGSDELAILATLPHEGDREKTPPSPPPPSIHRMAAQWRQEVVLSPRLLPPQQQERSPGTNLRGQFKPPD